MSIKRTGKSPDEHYQDAHNKLLKAMKEVGMELEGKIKLVTPVDTGALRRSITNKTSEDGSKITTEVGSYGIEYAYIVDQKVPYLESTVDENLEEIRRKIKDVMDND